jgi:hypothetical protein
MPLNFATIVLLLVAMTALPLLALASPPDPLWIGGVFDAADYDDVVISAISTDYATDGVALEAVRALWLVLGAVPASGPIGAARSVLPVFQGRAPPIA